MAGLSSFPLAVTDDLLTQAQIEQELIRLSGLAEKVTHEIAKRAMAAAHADAAYKKAYAQSYLLAQGTVGTRECTADLECADEYLERRTTEALLMSARSAGENYRMQISALQTLASNIRAIVSR